MTDERMIAYFSMEIALAPGMATYSGGLGVLAGDTVRSAADLAAPMIAVSLLHRKGYFHQTIDATGWQQESTEVWPVENFLLEVPGRAQVTVEGRTVFLRAWRYDVRSSAGFQIPVYFLDTDLRENSAWDGTLTDSLYGGDHHYRLCQEVILGIGGVRMLRRLGYTDLERFHMNEGHASLLVLELLDEEAKKASRQNISREDIEAVRKKCVFTTHTPVPAGHDQFSMELVQSVLGRREVYEMKDVFCCEGRLNMTFLGFNLSHYINGVAKKHGEVSRRMFAGYQFDSITNGVHAASWVAKPYKQLYDKHIPGWEQDNFSLRYALSIPKEEIWSAHVEAKTSLIQHVNRETNLGMEVTPLTIGFARRAATYKRADLLFQDINRLKRIASQTGSLQLIYAGKAHPQDKGGKDLIQRIFQFKESLTSDVKIAYLEGYDLELGKLITSGVDIWLNTPEPPLEASGTSGMKAALNGVPSLSILDGWWIEGCLEGVTGWAIGNRGWSIDEPADRSKDASSLYDKLEQAVVPLFCQERDRFIDIMRHAIALNGSFFNTQRMVQQYVLKAYF